jgi:hypothetical protein
LFILISSQILQDSKLKNPGADKRKVLAIMITLILAGTFGIFSFVFLLFGGDSYPIDAPETTLGWTRLVPGRCADVGVRSYEAQLLGRTGWFGRVDTCMALPMNFGNHSSTPDRCMIRVSLIIFDCLIPLRIIHLGWEADWAVGH